MSATRHPSASWDPWCRDSRASRWTPAFAGMTAPRPRRALRLLLRDLALQAADLEAQFVVAGLDQPIVEAADMLDRPQAGHRDAQLDAARERVGDERDVLQIGQERALGLVVGVGNVVAHQPALAGQLANARHFNLFLEWGRLAPRKGGADSGIAGIRQPPRQPAMRPGSGGSASFPLRLRPVADPEQVCVNATRPKPQHQCEDQTADGRRQLGPFNHHLSSASNISAYWMTAIEQSRRRPTSSGWTGRSSPRNTLWQMRRSAVRSRRGQHADEVLGPLIRPQGFANAR